MPNTDKLIIRELTDRCVATERAAQTVIELLQRAERCIRMVADGGDAEANRLFTEVRTILAE